MTLVFEIDSFTLASSLSLRHCQNAVFFPRIFIVALCIHLMDFVGLGIVCTIPALHPHHELCM